MNNLVLARPIKETMTLLAVAGFLSISPVKLNVSTFGKAAATTLIDAGSSSSRRMTAIK